MPITKPGRRAFAAIVLALAACNAHVEQREPAAAAAGVTIMTFNVENLFDTRDDPGKDDATYLPLAQKQNNEHRAACELIEVARWREQCLNWDWSEEVLERKLRAVADAILHYDGGRGPDIVVLQEVENLGVLERLRREYLSAAGYNPGILIEGDDLRGIDVAFLSRLPLAREPVLHKLRFPGFAAQRVADTRGILEATFRLPDGNLLTGFAVHFPAPFHPREMRLQAFAQLEALRTRLPADRYVFAAGDFNTTAAEDAEHAVFKTLSGEGWVVAHRAGCGGCRGTHYYGPADSWSFLDTILFAPPRDGAARWRVTDVRLANGYAAHVTTAGTPARFQLPEATGVSDHWPLALRLEPAASP